MAYKPTVWVDGKTPVNAENLNKLENGVAAAVVSVNGIAPDENGNVEIAVSAQKKEVLLAAEKTVTAGDGGGFPDLNASMVYAGMPLVLYWDGVRYEAEVEEDSSIYYARFVNDNDEAVTYLFFNDTDTTLAYAGDASHVASVYYWNEVAAGGSGGGGLNAKASALLIEILRNGVYSTNQSANITALEAALASSGSGSDDSGDDSGDSGDSGNNDGTGGEDDITVIDGVMTIISVGSAISVTDGVMTIA